MRHRYAIDTSWQELSANRTALARRKTLEIGKILDTFPHFYVKTRPEPQKIHLNIFKKISKNFPGARSALQTKSASNPQPACSSQGEDGSPSR